MSTSAPPTGGPDIELEIGGMTCASCANRIEKKLNKLDGVSATVNYATEKAKVTVPDGYDPALLIAEVEKTGYTAVLPSPPAKAACSIPWPTWDTTLTARSPWDRKRP